MAGTGPAGIAALVAGIDQAGDIAGLAENTADNLEVAGDADMASTGHAKAATS
jgi:hypothetical protein